MKEKSSQDHGPEEKTFSIGYFLPGDAEGIVQLFQEVYGNHYPVQLFYDANAIIKANAEQSNLSIVARSESGEVVGVCNLCNSSPYKALYEWSAGLVRKDYRNLGINKALSDYLHHDYVPGQAQIEELFGEPVCNHIQLQKTGLSYGYVETGLEVALMPAEAYDREKSATGRVATVAFFRSCQSKPQRIYLPKAYEAVLRTIYARLDDQRDLALSEAAVPGGPETRIDVQVFDFAQVARIAVHTIGADFLERFLEREKEAKAKNVWVFQAWLDMSQSHVGEAVEALRKAGYFFGGALPRWLDGDAILMQKLLCPPYFEQIQLYSDDMKGLLAVIEQDWRRTQ